MAISDCVTKCQLSNRVQIDGQDLIGDRILTKSKDSGNGMSDCDMPIAILPICDDRRSEVSAFRGSKFGGVAPQRWFDEPDPMKL